MKSIIALRTIPEMVKLSGVYPALWFARETAFVRRTKMGWEIGVLRADSGGPRANRIISTKFLDKFVCFIFVIVLPRNPPLLLFVAVSRNRNFRNTGYRPRRFSRTYFPCTQQTRGILTRTGYTMIPITTDTRYLFSGPISLCLAIMRIFALLRAVQTNVTRLSPTVYIDFLRQPFRFSFSIFLSLSLSLSFSHFRSLTLFFYLAQSASQPSRKLQVVQVYSVRVPVYQVPVYI